MDTAYIDRWPKSGTRFYHKATAKNIPQIQARTIAIIVTCDKTDVNHLHEPNAFPNK